MEQIFQTSYLPKETPGLRSALEKIMKIQFPTLSTESFIMKLREVILKKKLLPFGNCPNGSGGGVQHKFKSF